MILTLVTFVGVGLTLYLANPFDQTLDVTVRLYRIGVVFLFSIILLLLLLVACLLIFHTRQRRLSLKELVAAKEVVVENLREADVTLKLILDRLPVSIFICKSDMQIDWASGEAKKMTGVSAGETLQQMKLGIDVKVSDKNRNDVNLFALAEKFKQQEVEFTKVGGESHPALLNKETYEAAGEEYHLFCALDLTTHKKLEKSLMHARKMESVGQLAAGFTQEFNSPAQFIGPNLHFIFSAVEDVFQILESYERIFNKIYLDANPETSSIIEQLIDLKEDENLSYLREELPKATLQTKEGIERITQIVRVIKKVSQPFTVGGSQSVDINAIFEAIVDIAGSQWTNVANIELDLTPELQAVDCVMGEITEVLQRFIENGIKAIENAIEPGAYSKGILKIVTSNSKDFVEIQISDSGTGISQEMRTKIENSAFTSVRPASGSGQGLYLAYKLICDKHGGTLQFDTAEGVGTVFTIRLPAAL